MRSGITNPSFAQGFARRGESASPNLWTGLVGAWSPPLGPTGLTLFDQSGYGNDGTLTNMDPATDWMMTEKGWALDFDGSNDYVNCGSNLMNEVWDELTISVLANLSTNGSFGMVCTGPYYTPGGWFFGHTGGTARYGFSAGNSFAGYYEDGFDFNVWCRYSMVYSKPKSIMRLYRDDILLYEKTSGTFVSLPDSGNDVVIGLQPTTGYNMKGILASASIWNRALTPNEIMQLYLDPAALFRFPHHYRSLDGLPAVSDRVGRGVLTGGRM